MTILSVFFWFYFGQKLSINPVQRCWWGGRCSRWLEFPLLPIKGWRWWWGGRCSRWLEFPLLPVKGWKLWWGGRCSSGWSLHCSRSKVEGGGGENAASVVGVSINPERDHCGVGRCSSGWSFHYSRPVWWWFGTSYCPACPETGFTFL